MMNPREIKNWLAGMAVIGLSANGIAMSDMLLVDKGVSKVPILVAADAPVATTEAVRELAAYIEKISGAKPEILIGTLDSIPTRAIWVGMHPNLAKIFPDVKLDFTYPEEILQVCDGRNLLIAGRDRIVGTNQVEYGTANSVYTFIEKRLDVRWLWPGELGEDIIQKETLAFAPFDYRFHPVILKRHFWPQSPRDWHRHQRLLLYSYPLQCGHAFTDWWEKYGETHPEYFALLSNGTRKPQRNGRDVKICLSNPGVWTQWLDNAEAKLKADLSIRILSASPNDGGEHCTCEACRAWDHPDAPIGSLTERHVKFWNILARGLKERFPDREVYVGGMAYAAYYAPPVAEKLEPNVSVAQVGHFPLTDRVNRKESKQDWSQWANLTTLMWYRPNLWYWAGGVWGLPEVSMKKTIEDFRFLADNKSIGIEIDSVRSVWSTQGPTYYLMAQLTYDPYQDGEAVMKDYYRRAFGPAAAEMETYWTMLEDACEAVMDDPDFKRGSNARYKLLPIFTRIYSQEALSQIEAVLQEAESRVADSDLYKRRVAFVRTGFDFTRLLVRTIPVMTRVRESQARDQEAVREAQALWEAIAKVAEGAAPWALPLKNIRDHYIGGRGYQGGMQDYFGPPSEELIALQYEKRIRLQPAEWTLMFSDAFDRDELGSNWNALEGRWFIKDGALQTDGDGTIVCMQKFPGLQKVVFDAVATPNPLVSDISPFIQATTNNMQSGYFLRFGGNYNKDSGIQREGKLMQDSLNVIEAGKTHQIVAEYNGIQVRLTVDGKLVSEFTEMRPLFGEGHDRIGFYVYEGTVRITNLKVFTSPALEVGQVATDGEGFE